MSRSITRQLIALAVPVIGINLLTVLMLVVDSALCGHLPKPEADHALSAIGYALQLVFLLMAAMLGLVVGAVALVARAHGAGDHARVKELLVQSTQLTALVGIVLAVAGAVFARPMFLALGASDAVADAGVDYLRPLMLGTPFSFLGILYAGVFRGIGNTRVPFACVLIANVVNAALNYALILGHFGAPALGVTGSALGTSCANVVNVALLVWAIRRTPQLRFRFVVRAIDVPLARELVRIGWPAALDMLMFNVSFLSALAMLAAIDQITVAAHNIGMRVQSLVVVFGTAIGQAAAAMIGHSLGACDVARAHRVLRSALVLALVAMTGLTIPIILGAPLLVQLFDVTPGTPLEEHAVQWMCMLGFAMPFGAVNQAFMGLFQGSGATRTGLAINAGALLAIQLPLAYVFGFVLDLGAFGVWLSFPFGFGVKNALNYIAYRRGGWAVTGLVPR